MVQLAGHIHRAAVGQVSPLRQAHPHDGVPGLQQAEVHRQVGLGPRVGLDVGVLGPKELFGPLPGQLLHLVHPLAAAVIPLAGVALGVFIGEHRPHGGQHRRGDDVLRGDKLQVPALALKLPLHSGPHLRVPLADKADGIHHICKHTRSFLSSSAQTGPE